ARALPARVLRYRNDGTDPAGCRTCAEIDGFVAVEHHGDRGTNVLVQPLRAAGTGLGCLLRSLRTMGGRSGGPSRGISSSVGHRCNTQAPEAAAQFALLGW